MTSSIKHRVAMVVIEALCSAPVGTVLARVMRNQIPVRGVRLSTDHDRILPEIKAALFWGFYEKAEAELIQAHLDPHADVIELGGSLGAVGALVAHRLAPTSRLVSVEADPDLLSLLEWNLTANSQGTPVTVLHRLVDHTARDSIGYFQPSERTTTGQIATTPSAPGTVAVERATLQTIRRETGIDTFTLVCDIEGAELDLIEAGPSAFDGCTAAFMEWHETSPAGRPIDRSAVEAALASMGFRFVEQRGDVAFYSRPTL